jgi:superfamily II DNA helicase RecQ
MVADIYEVVASYVGRQEHVPPEERLVEMYHGHLDDDSETRILKSFVSIGGHLRCVITTLAFGLGIQVPDIKYVLHWGPPQSILNYWQEVGRCARGSANGEAIMYLPPYSFRNVDNDMKTFVSKSEETCLRRYVLNYLKCDGMAAYTPSTNPCCSFCDKPQEESNQQ